MGMMLANHVSELMNWPHNEVCSVEFDARTAEAHREYLRRRARLYLANFLTESENNHAILGKPEKAETADDIDFGRSDCEFLFRD